MSKNNVEIFDSVGKDPKVTGHEPNGRIHLSVATNERCTDTRSGATKERTEWHSVICVGRLASLAARYVRKGSHVLVSGSLQSRKYDDTSGINRTAWDIHADELLLLDPRNYEEEKANVIIPELEDSTL